MPLHNFLAGEAVKVGAGSLNRPKRTTGKVFCHHNFAGGKPCQFGLERTLLHGHQFKMASRYVGRRNTDSIADRR